MKASPVDVVERTTELLTRFSLSTAAPELAQRPESPGHRGALLLVLEVLEMEAEAREQRKIAVSAAPRCFRPARASRRSMRARCRPR